MLDLGNDLFLLLAAIIGGVIGVVGSVIGARITGRFMFEATEPRVSTASQRSCASSTTWYDATLKSGFQLGIPIHT